MKHAVACNERCPKIYKEVEDKKQGMEKKKKNKTLKVKGDNPRAY